ncbi:hypothetical protein CAI21_18880 [Alkalilimnicola ehrlichii]|uniref:Uncharacterized protein n=1 Tax=Alkalilimnicola ehrlichii TaxID=351052 RepID=A0A3E0WIV9_9GAMM|nr:autotransporter outer membrane beta-barrel domain-containing protein [Alkalilimnicola ehrlichii]RFA25589.1 hypothetical protein CAI21_18880 [Alkalilimnicola ehrlichii]RFA32718.1 hypothetical protein CAL65_19145 [Alkalilimnicola ehrlichii]
MLKRLSQQALTVVTASLLAAPAAAQWELEADPFAYAVNGFSAHIAHQLYDGSMRVQLGVFGADVPEFFHGDDDFDLRVRGVTAKADYFFSGVTQGIFAGLDVDYSRTRYRLEETRETAHQNGWAVGPRIGYRFEFGNHFYVTPWVSLRYHINQDDIVISGQRYREDRYSIFPTVHLGWRF